MLVILKMVILMLVILMLFKHLFAGAGLILVLALCLQAYRKM